MQVTDSSGNIFGPNGLQVNGSDGKPKVISSGGGGGSIPHGTASGTDTYTVSIAGATSYNDGDAYLVRFPNGNTTGSTLNINGLGDVSLYRNNDGQLIGGDIEDGGEMLCIYNSTLNVFQLIGTSPNTLLAYVTNDEAITITKGQPVYAFGGQGDRLKVKLAYNTSDATSAQTVGLVLSTSIGANQKGFIILNGQLDGLSILPTSTWADGDPVYLGATAGSITNIKPHAPNHLVYLGFVTTANNGSAGRMYVRVQNGYELDELHDVQISGLADNDLLQYDLSTDLWQNKSLSSAGIQPTLSLTTTGTSGAATLVGSTLNIPQYGGGLDIGTSPITSGTIGRVLFQGTGNVLQQSANLFWDNTNGRLGIGTSSPSAPINIVGGTEVTSGEQRALILETSATNKTSLELLLNNTFTSTGRTWRIRSLSGGDFDIATSTTRYFYISNNGRIVVNGSSPISTAQFSVNGSMATNGGIQVQAGLSAPTGAGFELEYTGGIAYITSYNRTSSSWLPITLRGSLIDFVSSGTSTTRIATTGNFLINTTTDAGYKLNVNGTARVQNTLTVTSSSSNGALSLTQNSVGFAAQYIYRANVTNTIATLMFQDLKTGANSKSFSLGIGRSGDPQWTNTDFIFGFYSGSGGWQQSAKIFNASGNWQIENGTATSDINTAIFQINSTTKGFLPPRMTNAQMLAIATPAAGLVVYDTTNNKHCGYNGTAWQNFY